MKIQLLIAAVEQNTEMMLQRMKIETDAIVVNQCDTNAIKSFKHNDNSIVEIKLSSRGVGINRNTAIMNSEADILLFADQDITYLENYGERIKQEFENHPEADMILFNVNVGEKRKTYENMTWKRVRWYNCGRYGAVSFAIRRIKLLESRVMFSQLFGGGAKYAAGEDSLFLKDLMDRGVKVYASPIYIGTEEEGESSWFRGYDEKFFHDRGVLYHQLYGRLARLLAMRFLLAHRKKMCEVYSVREAYQFMKRGINQNIYEKN